MAAPRRMVTMQILSLTLLETGDRKVPQAQNAINALLIFPTPGRAEAFATTGLIPGLQDGKLLRFQPPLLLLKEYVQGPTDLQIVVTDRDDKNALVSFLRRIAGTLVSSTGAVVAGELPGVLRTAFREAAASGQLAVGGQREDKLETVAVGTLSLRAPEKLAGTHTVDLVAPRELNRAGQPPLERGAPNGTVEIEILTDED